MAEKILNQLLTLKTPVMKVAKQNKEWEYIESHYTDRIAKLQAILSIAKETYGRTHSSRVERKIRELTEEIEENTNALLAMPDNFISVNDNVTVDDLHKAGLKAWKWIPELKNYSKTDKDNYETFVIGFVTNYELYGRSGEDRDDGEVLIHTIYFDWGETRPGEYDLVIYLSPLSIETKEDDTMGDKYSTAAINKIMMQQSPLAPPPSDPGPLPGPPPPTKPISGGK
jgi:hypothetical protein